MKNCYVAVDIGASSGRLIVGKLIENKMQLVEIHRFKNNMMFKDHHYHWDIEHLYEEIVTGMKNLVKEDSHYVSIGIDTWAVDYVLVDDEGLRVAPVYAYRDHRTNHSMEKVFKKIPKETIYKKTGIQFLQFNTIYQLFEHRQFADEMKAAKVLMMVPDYLHYRLSGVKSIEYTNATSTQLLEVKSGKWDLELLESIGVDKDLFLKPIMPGTIIGPVKKDISKLIGIDGMNVVAPATHDTGSAVVSVPTQDKNYAYISSGTWSLMGIESDQPINGSLAAKHNFTNEGGVFNTYRVLKNIMGLWLIQEVQRMYEDKYSFADFVELAKEAKPLKCMINPNDTRFLNPKNMVEEIMGFCKERGQQAPETPGEIARCIFESLALLYKDILNQLEEISGQSMEKIHIIGGGCQNKLLNQMCADFTGLPVYAGPIEATAIGNLAMQMIASGEVQDLSHARELIRESFNIESYTPKTTDAHKAQYEKFRRLQNEQ
jgi:rhamnulokinase